MTPLFAWSSDEVRVMLRPERTYRRLADEVNATKDGSNPFWRAFKRPLFAAFMIGAFASLTSSGRFNALLVIDGMLFWSFVPLLQLLAITCVVLVLARGRFATTKAIELFFIGYGPWYLWLLIISGSCLLVPAKQIVLWPVQSGWIMPATLLIVWAWSNLTTFGFLRGALNLSTVRAAVALLVYNLFLWGIIISYLFAIETLQLHRLRF